jgi:acyl-CoA synthetase (AMP-forming)/AMP-acid ligase II/3-hydroxymyristoyl/3-hydroxydecanoyl-(acyl carrier protein) dehydratase
MIGLLQTIAAAPTEQLVFMSGREPISAGQIRQTASEIAGRLSGTPKIFLYTASASLFLAGLIAAARKNLLVRFPSHLQREYLREIGADAGVLLTDQQTEIASAIPLSLAAGEEGASPDTHVADPGMIFFTSGVTGAPKEVRKHIGSLDREAFVLDQIWGKEAGRVFATVSHQHIYGMLFRIFWPVITARVSEDRGVEYWEALEGKLAPGATLVSSPAHLTRLPDVQVLADAAPALVFSSGALLPLAAAQAVRDRFGTAPIEVLGSTETGGIAWRRQTKSDTLWTPLTGVRAEADARGHLHVVSPFVEEGRSVETGDLIERVGERFRLNGRADRIAKIEGKRVSLARVEEALLALPFVEAAAAVDLPLRNGALGAIVELSANGRTELQSRGPFRFSRALRTALAARLEPGERPKHWRFGAIPINRQGKRVQTLLRAEFDLPADDLLGFGAVAECDSREAKIEMHMPKRLIWFEGHFPDAPVLPGIAQVHLASQWAEHLWRWRPNGANLSRLKFRHIIRPGDSVRLTLTRDLSKQRLSFAYQLRDIVASEGVIGGGE